MFPQQPATHPEPEPATHAEPHPATHPELYQAQQPATHAGPHPATHPELYQAPQPEAPQPRAPQPEAPQAQPQSEAQPVPQAESYQVPQVASYEVPQAGPYQVPQPEPAATNVAGHEAPASGPPIAAPVGYDAPASGPPVTGPAEFPPSPPPPPPPGRAAFRILVAVAVVLAAAIAVTATLGWSSVSDLRRGVADREAEQAKIAQQEEAAARKVPEDFRSAGLESKLQRVKDLDKAADVAFNAWRNGGIRLGLLDEAMDDCNDAVNAYNTAAGPFPDNLFTALPRRIDLKNPETDCGRAFTGSI